MKKILFILLLSVTFSYSQPIDTKIVCGEYIVFSTMIAKYNIEKLQFKFGRLGVAQTIGRPELLSCIIYPRNWQYLIVNLSTTTETQNTFLDNTNVKKCYYKTKQWSLRSNGTKSETIFRDCPPDIWDIGISTP